LEDLSQTQYEMIVETFFEKRKRAEVAARHGISVFTYDNHLQAAFRSLRQLLKQDAEMFTNVDRPLWCDRIEQLCERHAAAQLCRTSGRKGKRSTSEGERSNVRGERANFEGERADFEGERANFEGERSHSAHEGDKNSRVSSG
jgi:hypothetical protein